MEGVSFSMGVLFEDQVEPFFNLSPTGMTSQGARIREDGKAV